MRGFVKLLGLALLAVLVGACTNKKVENNIKSLERRVAALERRSGIQTPPEDAEQRKEIGAQESNGALPVLSFESTEYNFGNVQQGDIVEHSFTFTNTGNAPLLISKATATCGCTVPEWPSEPVAVGETGVILVKFNTTGRKDVQTKYVTINANTKPEATRLKIFGSITAAEDSKS
jgi:hypothetical protein